jgi:WD40 repeat protein
VATLRLQAASPGTGGHSGEVFCCAYTPNGSAVLTGGWDGHLRLWSATDCEPQAAVQASQKAVSACAVSPNGKQWLAGSLDGLLTTWDAETHKRVSLFVPSGRPLAAVVFAADQQAMATASWDRALALWTVGKQPEGRTLHGHEDIVAGCRFTPSGRQIVSWSHDRTVRLWDAVQAQPVATLTAHADRVTAGGMSPDGRWAATGGRDGALKLWDLEAQAEAASVQLDAEIRGCFFLLDGGTLVVVDAKGRLTLHGLPDLNQLAEWVLHLPVQCGDLSPSGGQIALGCDDGRIQLVAVDGFDNAPLFVTVTQNSRTTSSRLQRLFGRSQVTQTFSCTCPVCQKPLEFPPRDPDLPVPCPHCQRRLRVSAIMAAAKE